MTHTWPWLVGYVTPSTRVECATVVCDLCVLRSVCSCINEWIVNHTGQRPDVSAQRGSQRNRFSNSTAKVTHREAQFHFGQRYTRLLSHRIFFYDLNLHRISEACREEGEAIASQGLT